MDKGSRDGAQRQGNGGAEFHIMIVKDGETLRYHLGSERKERIFAMWMACATDEEIAEETGITPKTADNQIGEFVNLEALPNLQKVTALHQDADFAPPPTWEAMAKA